MPADCFVLRTLTILPNIRISRESSRFYAHIGAGGLRPFDPGIIKTYNLKYTYSFFYVKIVVMQEDTNNNKNSCILC